MGKIRIYKPKKRDRENESNELDDLNQTVKEIIF
jgi:hypothetical protein